MLLNTHMSKEILYSMGYFIDERGSKKSDDGVRSENRGCYPSDQPVKLINDAQHASSPSIISRSASGTHSL